MKVLVCVASKHGGTEGIANEVAERLRAAGISVDLVPAATTPSLAKYDAVLIGSGVYLGRWMTQAREFVENNVEELRVKPVWLFSSGPITPIADEGDVADANELVELIGARGHKLFMGRLEKEGLGITERVAVSFVHSPWGDYRPWPEIREWADSIARELTAVPV